MSDALAATLRRMVRSLFASVVLSIAAAGCEPAPPPGPARLGVPDPTHGAITDDDLDGDGIPNGADNCPTLANADQRAACDYEFPPPEPSGTDPIGDVLARINFWRDVLGLEPVADDEDASAGCEAHARYLAELAIASGEVQLVREEDETNPHYSAEGAAAGAVALLSYTRFPVNDITRFLDLVLHRLPLLHPGLRRIGIAYDRSFLCVRADMPDAVPEGAHPVLWPPPDSAYASATFPGNEYPCLGWDDPTMGAQCLPAALMPSIVLPGHEIGPVSGTITRVDTGEEVPLLRAYRGGGPTDLEQSNLLEGAIVLATPEGSVMQPTEHEVRVEAEIDGEPQTFRWRFRAGPAIDQEIACNVFMTSNFSFETAVGVTTASGFGARICDMPMFYELRGTGTFRITVDYDPRVGDLELHAYDASRAELAAPEENDGHEVVEGIPAGGYFEVRGRAGATGAYVVLVEAM